MKKNFLKLILIIAVLFTVSCKNTNKSESTDETSTNTAEETAIIEDVYTKAESTDGVPNFSDPKVQEYVESYEAYIEEYSKVVESKDMTAFASLGQKGQELGTKAQEVMSNLSANDVKKLNDYMQEKSAELQELAKKLMQ